MKAMWKSTPSEEYIKLVQTETVARLDKIGYEITTQLNNDISNYTSQQNDKMSKFSVDLQNDFSLLKSDIRLPSFIAYLTVVTTGGIAMFVMALHTCS